MDDLVFSELPVLIQVFIVCGSTGVVLGFIVWTVRQLVNVFKRFF